jgi:hypothetical protein
MSESDEKKGRAWFHEHLVEQHYSPGTHEHLLVFDDDDAETPSVEEQKRWFETHPDAILVYSKRGMDA